MDLSPRYSDTTTQDEVPRFFGLGSEFKTTNAECPIQWEPIELISENELRVCFIGDVRTTPIPPFKSPEMINELHLDGFISHSNFLALFNPLIHLKLLEIHLSSLECLSFSTTCNRLDLPCLECLEISAANYTYDHAMKADVGGILENISAILITPTNFPLLTYLSVSTPTFPPMDEDFNRSILHCITNHKTTLKYLNVESEYPILEDSNGQIFEERLYVESPSKRDLNLAAINSAGDVNLSSFHYYSLIKSASTEIWRNFMLTQDNLEYLQFWCQESHYPFPTDLLERNRRLIHTIALNVDVLCSTTTPIDLQIFRDCPELKTLFVKGNVNLRATPHLNSPNLENVEMLPESLLFLKIMNLLIDSDDASFFVNGLPNLKTLLLGDIGEEGHFGMRLSDLADLLQNETIQKIELIASINRSSLTEPSQSQSGFEIMAKILLAKQDVTYFRVARNPEGGFDPLSDDEEEEDEEDDEEVALESPDADDDLPEAEPCEEVSPEDVSPDNETENGNDSCEESENNNNREIPVVVPGPSGQPQSMILVQSASKITVQRRGSSTSAVADLVDEDEANLDMFVRDFTKGIDIDIDPPS